MTTPTPTAHGAPSAELQAAIKRVRKLRKHLIDSANRLAIEPDAVRDFIDDINALETVLTALSQSSEAQRAVEQPANTELKAAAPELLRWLDWATRKLDQIKEYIPRSGMYQWDGKSYDKSRSLVDRLA